MHGQVEDDHQEQIDTNGPQVNQERQHRFGDRQHETGEDHEEDSQRHGPLPWVPGPAATSCGMAGAGGGAWTTTSTSSRREKSTAGTTCASRNIPLGRLATLVTFPTGVPCGKALPPGVTSRSFSCRSSVRSAYSSLHPLRSPMPFTLLRPRV